MTRWPYFVSALFGWATLGVLRLDYFFLFAIDKPRLEFGVCAMALGIAVVWLVRPRSPRRAVLSAVVSLLIVIGAAYLYLAIASNSRFNLYVDPY